MSFRLRTLLPVLAFIFIFLSCQKEVSFESDPGTTPPVTSGSAAFMLDGSPGNCVTPVINATYQAGVALGDTNTIIAKVTVTDTGTYTITSASNNGIVFSASGIFTNIGQSTIIFTGSGTPVAAGTFNFILGTGGCSAAVVVKAGTTPPPTTPPADCKTCIYIPVCETSKYEYEDTTYGIPSMRNFEYLNLTDTTINGVAFKKIPGGSSANDSYLSCVNGETKVLAFNPVSGGGNTVDKIEAIMLKANAPVGTTWQNTQANPAGQELIQKYKIVEKNISLTINGLNFPDVIHVNLETGVNAPIVGYVAAISTEYYYAKGVGLVLSTNLDLLSGAETYRSAIKSYFIP